MQRKNALLFLLDVIDTAHLRLLTSRRRRRLRAMGRAAIDGITKPPEWHVQRDPLLDAIEHTTRVGAYAAVLVGAMLIVCWAGLGIKP